MNIYGSRHQWISWNQQLISQPKTEFDQSTFSPVRRETFTATMHVTSMQKHDLGEKKEGVAERNRWIRTSEGHRWWSCQDSTRGVHWYCATSSLVESWAWAQSFPRLSDNVCSERPRSRWGMWSCFKRYSVPQCEFFSDVVLLPRNYSQFWNLCIRHQPPTFVISISCCPISSRN